MQLLARGQTSPILDGPSSVGRESEGMCEVCTYVLQNKAQHQPYLCRGLKDPDYQNVCVQVMESMMWWVTNEVYWMNYGCQKTENNKVQWERPCPPHAVCSWLQHLYYRQPFCPEDIHYPKPMVCLRYVFIQPRGFTVFPRCYDIILLFLPFDFLHSNFARTTSKTMAWFNDGLETSP